MQKLSNQAKFNYLNLSIAVLALIISLPSMVNQIRQFFDDSERALTTSVVFYSAPTLDKSLYQVAEKCWDSIASNRFDAYRCSSKDRIYDPCFRTDYYVGYDATYLSCPQREEQSDESTNIYATKEHLERQYAQDSKPIDFSIDLPWLIYIDDTYCRLFTGAVGTAYADKGNIYGCNSEKYTSVTSGYIEKGRHYFQCKLKNENIFRKCLAKTVVY